MNKVRLCISSAIILTSLLSTGWAQDSPIQKRTQDFLNAYIGGDRNLVLSLIDPKDVTMFGRTAAATASHDRPMETRGRKVAARPEFERGRERTSDRRGIASSAVKALFEEGAHGWGMASVFQLSNNWTANLSG
jgi:hypothetical protein